jgi:RNA polymerase sigma-70 factor (ECF subfamily)
LSLEAVQTVALTQIDRDLLDRCLAGSKEGWTDFVNRYTGLFVHVIRHASRCRGMSPSADDVEDLCADIYVTLLERDFAILRQFRGKASLATYLCVIARRIVVRQLSNRRAAEVLGHVNAEPVLERIPARPGEAERLDDREQIQLMLEGLAEPQASIIRQYHLEGRSYREISDDLGISENSIGPTLSRAMARLRIRSVQT